MGPISTEEKDKFWTAAVGYGPSPLVPDLTRYRPSQLVTDPSKIEPFTKTYEHRSKDIKDSRYRVWKEQLQFI